MRLDPANDYFCSIRIHDDEDAAFLSPGPVFPPAMQRLIHYLLLCLQVVFDAYKRKGRARKYVTPNEVR